MWFVIPYYDTIFIFAVLDRRLINFNETECGFVYLILYLSEKMSKKNSKKAASYKQRLV